MVNPSAAVASQSIPVPVAGGSGISSGVGAMLNDTGNVPASSTQRAAISELAQVIGMAHRGYDNDAVLIRGEGPEPWDLDYDNQARVERRIAQAQACIDPGRSSPSGVASRAILQLVEEGYGATTAEYIRNLYPTLAHGGAVTKKLLDRLRADLTPSNLRESGSFSDPVSARTQEYIAESLQSSRPAAQDEFERDLTRAVYVVNGNEVSWPGLARETALANFESAIPDPRARESLRHIAFQGTLADAEHAATGSDEVFAGGYGIVTPERAWCNRDDLKYDIRHEDNGGYTVVARNRRYASRACDPYIANLDAARPLGAGSHYDICVQVTVPASAIEQGRFDEITVTSSYEIDFHPPTPVAPVLQTLLRNVQAGDTPMATFIANVDALHLAVRMDIERRIEDGSMPAPNNAEESIAQWREVVGDAARDIAWATQKAPRVAYQDLAFAASEHVPRFTGQLPDAMALIEGAAHYGVDKDRLDTELINDATAPFTIMQQVIMPELAQLAFGQQANDIATYFELLPQRDPTKTPPETMRLLRDRFAELGLLAGDQSLSRATPALINEPGLPRRVEDGTRVVDIEGTELVVLFDKMTDTWRVAGPTGHATGDHLLFDDSTGAWVRRPPGLLGGTTEATVLHLLGGDLAGSLDALASLVELEPVAAADILLQPGVLDALAGHVATAMPLTATQQPHAALPLQAAAEICRNALIADDSLGQRIADAWLPRESLADSPIARLLAHHSLYLVQPATDAATQLLTHLSRSDAMRRTLYERLETPAGGHKRLSVHLEKSPALGDDAFRKHIRGRLADAGVVSAYRAKRALTPEQTQDQIKRRRMPDARELREYARAATERTQVNHGQVIRMSKAARDAAANVQQRDAEIAAKRAVVKKWVEEANQRSAASTAVYDAERQHRRKLEEDDRQQRLSADHHAGQQASYAARVARQYGLSTAIAAFGAGQELARRERAAQRAIVDNDRGAAKPAVPLLALPTASTPRALPAANAARALPQAAGLPGPLASRNDAVMLPPGSNFNRRSGRVEVPVISQGRDATLSVPLQPERPMVFQVAMPRQAAIEAPRQPDARATLVNIDNRPAGVAITVRSDGHTGRFAIPHQRGEPVRLTYGNDMVVSYTRPGAPLPRNVR